MRAVLPIARSDHERSDPRCKETEMTTRLFVATISVLGIYFGADSLKGIGMPTEVAHPQFRLEEMPKSFGHWTGEDTALDPELFRAIGAEMAINRRYKDGRVAVDMHADVFTDLFLQYGVAIIHSPVNCYPMNGFVVDNSEPVQIESAGNNVHLARLLTLSRDGARVYCLFWYQVGEVTFWNADEQRSVVHTFRGRKTWPPMIKVMLQTSADSPEQAQQRLKPLASSVYAWAREFH
jgi:hypothetical protein